MLILSGGKLIYENNNIAHLKRYNYQNLRKTTWCTSLETKTQYVTNNIIHGNAKVRSSPRHYGWRTILDDEGLKGRYCLDWWIKLLSAHGIDNYARVMYVIVRTGVRSESIIASLTHYSRESLPCFVD
ncbi:hypothetical protein YC2023_032985 [Brassica napus]